MNSIHTFDRQSALRDDLDALEALLADDSTMLVPLHRGQVLVHREQPDALAVLSLRVARPLLALHGELVFLGKHENRGYLAIDVSEVEDPEQLLGLEGPYALRDLRLAAGLLSPLHAHLAAYGRGMLHFHETTRYCGRCGEPTRPRKGGHVRYCSRCNKELFPRLEPAVLTLVQHQGRLLLGRQPGFPKGMYSALAGFVETGESLEDAARREVYEEVGLSIHSLRYAASQPWPFPCSLMVGFHAITDETDITLDQQELEDARFFTVAELRNPSADFWTPKPYALAGQLISSVLDASD